MDPAGGRDERRRQAERLRREEAYYHFINELNEEEYRLMRDGNLLGTPGEVTAEELRQRLDGAKERVSSQPRPEQRLQASTDAGDQEGSSGAPDPGAESSNGDSLLEWLNTFRRTGNATRSGQSGNQTWRAVSRTNPNSGEFRFSLEININHEQPEPGEHSEAALAAELPAVAPNTTSTAIRTASYLPPVPRPSTYAAPYPTPRPSISRRAQARRTRSANSSPRSAQDSVPPAPPPASVMRRGVTLPPTPLPTPPHPSFTPPSDQAGSLRHHTLNAALERGRDEVTASLECPRVSPPRPPASQSPPGGRDSRGSRTRSRGRIRRAAGGASSRSSRRSRSPLSRTPVASSAPVSGLAGSGSDGQSLEPGAGTSLVSMETQEAGLEPVALTEAATEAGDHEREAQAAAAGAASVRRHPTIMLDLQVRRIRPGENRDRDSIASRTRSRARVAENTVTFESDSGGFRRTISRSERAGIRTYVSTIRIPLRRISETGLGEPNSTALRSILRQIMTGFGELSSLMETEADSETVAPSHLDAPSAGANPTTAPAYRLHGNESTAGLSGTGAVEEGGGARAAGAEDDGQGRQGGGVMSPAEGRATSRDTNNLVENGTLPILRLAHFFLLNDEEDEDHPRGLTKEQIDNLATRTYGQASLEGEAGRACSVCINEYAQGNKLRRLPCSHEFHIHCIDRWLSENNTCPICRQPILAAHHE
ncbi:unnamed protein product [Boreogadus saida]